MSRFFKSAAFPILIVVVLAFLAVKLVNSNTGTAPTQLPAAGPAGTPRRQGRLGRLKNKGKALEVKLKNKEQYNNRLHRQAPRPG